MQSVSYTHLDVYKRQPYVRGREKSRPLDDIAAEARSYVEAGVKEITLLGQNVNSYGRDLYGEPRFADVLRAVDAAGIERLRFATSHPKDLTDEVIGLFATLPSLMLALHLPVQSGSNRILSAMNRRYVFPVSSFLPVVFVLLCALSTQDPVHKLYFLLLPKYEAGV